MRRCIWSWMLVLAVVLFMGSAVQTLAKGAEGAAVPAIPELPPIPQIPVIPAMPASASADVSEVLEVPEVKDMEIARQTNALKVSVHYPVLGVDGVDVDTARWAENLVREFERSAVEDRREPSAPPYQLEVSYEVARPSAGVVSVIFEVGAYTGGAHGTLDIIVRTYDLNTKLPLTFAHMFEDPEAALNIMSTYAYETLRVELGENVVEDMLKAGTTPDADNFSTLSLRPAGVRIHFAPYQVAPWSQGPLFVDIPLETLADARPHLELWGKTAEASAMEKPATPVLTVPSMPIAPTVPSPSSSSRTPATP